MPAKIIIRNNGPIRIEVERFARERREARECGIRRIHNKAFGMRVKALGVAVEERRERELGVGRIDVEVFAGKQSRIEGRVVRMQNKALGIRVEHAEHRADTIKIEVGRIDVERLALEERLAERRVLRIDVEAFRVGIEDGRAGAVDREAEKCRAKGGVGRVNVECLACEQRLDEDLERNI
jgi:hypothetical protein